MRRLNIIEKDTLILIRQARESIRHLEETQQRPLEGAWAVQDQIFSFGKQLIFPWHIEYLSTDLHRCECAKCKVNIEQIINIGFEVRYKAYVEEVTAKQVRQIRGTATKVVSEDEEEIYILFY